MTPESERKLREYMLLHPDGRPTAEELWEAAWAAGIAYETVGHKLGTLLTSYRRGDKSYRELERDLEDATDEITRIKQELAALKKRADVLAALKKRADVT